MAGRRPHLHQKEKKRPVVCELGRGTELIRDTLVVAARGGEQDEELPVHGVISNRGDDKLV
jgi:hypothetical protein